MPRAAAPSHLARKWQPSTSMSLEQYCSGKRMIVQNADATAYEAIRALSANHVGAVIVQEKGRVVGIATDRDLACRTIGVDLDPRRTRLKDVMSPGPVTISISDTEEQAALLMRARHVRRIPIVSDGRPAGIVTLDDLLLTGAVDLEVAGQIVESQLVEPSASKPAGVPHPVRIRDSRVGGGSSTERGEARASQTLQAFQSRLQKALGILDRQRALTAFDVVASSFVRRITPGEAKDFASQLPRSIQNRLLDLPAGPDLSVTSESLVGELAEKLDIERGEATRLARLVAASLADFVSVEEVRDLIAQLPADMKRLFPER
jgi:uncharacterized protein (DUF2267 family)/predicted transcriptional regulator